MAVDRKDKELGFSKGEFLSMHMNLDFSTHENGTTIAALRTLKPMTRIVKAAEPTTRITIIATKIA